MKGPVKWQKRHAAIALLGAASLIAVLSVALKGRDNTSAVAGAAQDVPANLPEDLLCDLYVGSPNASWSKLQRGIGGAVGILPATLPGVIVTLADLEVTLANELDGTAPMYGVAAGDAADPGFALAMKLVDSRRARGLLVDGDAARYTATEAPGMTVLAPRRAGQPKEHALALALTHNGYLLLSRKTADLARLGPYVTRSLPSRPVSGAAAVVDVPRSAVQTILKPKLESLWRDGKSFLLTQDERMRAERGRAPDFGDPVAIVATLDSVLSRRIAILGALDHVRVTLDVTEDAAVITAMLAPGQDEANEARRWISAMKVGDASPLLELPAASALAVFMRDGEAERAEQLKTLENAISSSVGSRLKEPEKLHDLIEAMTKAQGESFALALGVEEPVGLLVRAALRDVDAENKAIRGAFELARVEPFKELLSVREVTSANEELPGLGPVNLLTLVREPASHGGSRRHETETHPVPPARSDAGAPRRAASDAGAPSRKPTAFGVAWMTDRNALALAAGAEPLVTLKLGANPDKKLADEPSLKRFTAALGSNASTVVVGQPLLLDPKRANLPMAPLGIAVGRQGGDAYVRVDIADALLREAARWQMGF